LADILTEEWRSWDDGLIIGWTYSISSLVGSAGPPPGDMVEISSSASVSTQGPVQTTTYMHKDVYKIRKRIIVDHGLQGEAYAGLQQTLPDHLAPRIINYPQAQASIAGNIHDPVALANALDVQCGNRLSSAFRCVNALKDAISVTDAVFKTLTAMDNFSLDFLLRTMYQGMGLKIIFAKDGSSMMADITGVSNGGGGYEVPGEDLMNFSSSLDNTQIPNSYVASIDSTGHLSSDAPNPKDSPLQRDAMINRNAVRYDEYSHLSASVLPSKAIEFGLFKMVSINALGLGSLNASGSEIKLVESELSTSSSISYLVVLFSNFSIFMVLRLGNLPE